MSNPTPDDVPALTDIQVGEETVFVESPEHVAARTSLKGYATDPVASGENYIEWPAVEPGTISYTAADVEMARRDVMTAHPSQGQRVANTSGSRDQFLDYAINAVLLESSTHNEDVKRSDLFVVWFAKVLGNWKALVGQRSSTNYFEVTFNGYGDEAYVDRYTKYSNTKIAGDKIREDI